MLRYLVEEPKGFKEDGTPLFYVECSGSTGDEPRTSSTGGAIVDGSLFFNSSEFSYSSWNEDEDDWKPES